MIWRLKSLCGFSICILLIAFIGVFLMTSVAYCDEFRTWNEVDLKNMLINGYVIKTSQDADTMVADFANFETELQTLLGYLNDYKYCYISFQTYNVFDFQVFNATNLYNVRPYFYRNCLSFRNTPTGKTYRVGHNNQGWYLQDGGNVNSASSNNHYNDLNYCGSNVYQSSSSDTVIRLGGDYAPSTLFDENYFTNDYFFININDNSDTQHIKINTEFGVDLENIPVLYSGDFGTLENNKFDLINGDTLSFWYYSNGVWINKTILNRYEENWDRLPGSFYMDTDYISPESTALIVNDLYLYKNVVYQYYVNAGGETAVARFLVADVYTLISGDTLDTSSSYFNGGGYSSQFDDLDNQINNNNNTQAIIDNTNNGDEVDSIVDDFLGESGEELAESLGYNPMENTYAGFIYGLIDDICDTLYDSGDVYFDYTLHGGEPYRIYSSDIYLPNGALKTFISGFLIFGACFIIYRHFKRLIDAFNSADLGLLINYDVDDINIYYL